jgi:tetratricopeptide (TPR) repeat protein
MKREGSSVIVLFFVFTSACLMAPRVAHAQPNVAQSPASNSLESLLHDAEAAENRFDSKAALALYLRANELRPRDAFILQKISRQYSDLATDSTDEAERVRLCTNGLSYAQKSVELAPDNSVHVLSVAICYGKLALWSDIRTRIRYSKLVREYAERALALNPNYDYAHHVLGRWHYEVATLGATKRWLVRLIYGELPPASLDEAVSHLKRAVELSPHLPAHRVELGFALLAQGKKSEAKEVFQRALSMPMREKYDGDALRRAREALAGL